MKVRQLAITATVAVAATGFTVALPTQRAAADPPCLTGQVCVYRNGALVNRLSPVPSGKCWWSGSSKFDFVRNLSGVRQRAWSAKNCMGSNRLFQPRTSGGFSGWSIGGY